MEKHSAQIALQISNPSVNYVKSVLNINLFQIISKKIDNGDQKCRIHHHCIFELFETKAFKNIPTEKIYIKSLTTILFKVKTKSTFNLTTI